MQTSKAKILFSVTIPGRPKSLKNKKRVGKTFSGRSIMYSSDEYVAWARMVFRDLLSAKQSEMITSRVNMKMLVYLKSEKNEPDLSNSYQGYEDLLQAAGIIKNDKLISSHDGSRKIFGDKVERVEITLSEFVE